MTSNRPTHVDNFAHWLGDAPGQPAPDPLATALDRLWAAGPAPEVLRRAQNNVHSAVAARQRLWFAQLDLAPIGDVFLAASEEGLLALDFGVDELSFVEHMRRKLGARLQRAPERLSAVAAQLREYARGERTQFDVPLDLSLTTEFQRRVLQAARAVPPGSVATYGEIAQRIGKPKAARAVGQALGRNPIPIIIPCHRVLASDGSLGGYSGGGGVETKRLLLQLEGAL